MPLSLTTKASLTERVGSVEVLDGFARNTDANIDRAILVASDKFRSAALNQYTEDSVDALTAATITPEPQFHIESLALDVLTIGQVRPDDIGQYAVEAREWLKYLAGGTVNIADLIRISASVDGGEGSGFAARRTARDRVIDRDSNDTSYDMRNPKI